MRNTPGLPVSAISRLAGLPRVLENRLMNRRLCVWVVSILCGFCCLSAVQQSSAQPAPAAAAVTLPAGVEGNQSESLQDKLGIAAYVNAQYALLSGTDSTIQTAARKSLISVLPKGATPAFYTEFSKDWANAVTAGLAANPPVAVRLNIGIVTKELAESNPTVDTASENLVVALLGDRDPCVVLWGIKAAKPMVQGLLLMGAPGQLNPPVTTHPLVGAIVKAVKKNGKSEVAGFIAVDAYDALVVDTIPGQLANNVVALAPPLVNPILDILEFRLSQYKDGVPDLTGKLGPVQAPAAEKGIGTFLSGQLALMTPATQRRTVKDMSDLLSLLGQRAALYQNSSYDLAQIRSTLLFIASALKVLVPSIADSKQLGWFFPPPPACTPQDMLDRTKVIFPLIQKDPAFTTLTAPPTVTPIEPPPLVDTAKPAAAGTPPAP